MGSGSSLSPHLVVLQMLLIFTTASSPLTKAAEFLGSGKTMCHRVPWVKCMLLGKAFPLVYLLDETFGDLQHLRFRSQPTFPCPTVARCPAVGAASDFKVLAPSAQLSAPLSLGDSQHFLASSGMLTFSTQTAECWERREGGPAASHGFIICWPRS